MIWEETMNRKTIISISLVVLILSTISFAFFFTSGKKDGNIKIAKADPNTIPGFWSNLSGQEGIEPITSQYENNKGLDGIKLGENEYYFQWYANNNGSNKGQLYSGIWKEGFWSGGEGEEYPYAFGEGNSTEARCFGFTDNQGIAKVYSVWCESGDQSSSIKMSMYSPGRGWGFEYGKSGQSTLPNAATYNQQPSMCLDNENNPMVAWVAPNLGLNAIAVSFWINNQWCDYNGNPTPGFEVINLQYPYGGGAKNPTIILDKLGRPLVLWIDTSINGTDIFLAVRTQNGWENYTGGPISPVFEISGDAYHPKIDFNSLSLEPEIIWVDGALQIIYFARYTASGWVGLLGSPAPMAISDPGQPASSPDFISDESQNYYLAFTTFENNLATKHVSVYSQNGIKRDFIPDDLGTNFSIWSTYPPASELLNWPSSSRFVSCVCKKDSSNQPWKCKCYNQTEMDMITGYTISHARRVNLSVAKAEWDPKEVNIIPGEKVNITVNITGHQYAPETSIHFAISNLPSGITGSFYPAEGIINSSQGFQTTLTLEASTNVKNCDEYIHINILDSQNADCGSFNIKVKVAMFSARLAGNENTIKIYPDSSGSFEINLEYADGFTSTITPTTKYALPEGLSVLFSPSSIDPQTGSNVTATFTSSPTIVPATYDVIIVLTSSDNNIVEIPVKIIITVFNMICERAFIKEKSWNVSSVEWSIDIVPYEGYNGKIKLFFDGLEEGMTVSYSPSNELTVNGATVTVIVTLTYAQYKNSYDRFFIRGESHPGDTRSLSLTVQRGKFWAWAEQLHVGLLPGGTADYQIFLECFNLENVTINLTASGIPSGWAYCFDESQVAMKPQLMTSVMLSVKVPVTASSGTYTIIVSVQGGGETCVIPINITVQGFTVAVYTDQNIKLNRGESKLINVHVISVNGFDGDVELLVVVDPQQWWINAEFTSNPISCVPNGKVSTTLMISIDAGAPIVGMPDIKLSFKARAIDDGFEGWCPLVSAVNKYQTMGTSKTIKPLSRTAVPSDFASVEVLNEIPKITFDCPPYKLVRQIKQSINSQPVQNYSTFIPFLAMQVCDPSQYIVTFRRIEILYATGFSRCYGKEYGYNKFTIKDKAFDWKVEAELPSLKDQLGYCSDPQSTPCGSTPCPDIDHEITNISEAKKAIGMPSISTMSPRYINNVWSKIYSSEDIGPSCNNNVCIRDLRLVAFMAPYENTDVSVLPDLEVPSKIIVPLRGIFDIKKISTGEIAQVKVTKICEITYEKPLPNHSQGAEKVGLDWYVGDSHVHSACGGVRMSRPSYDSVDEVAGAGCPENCDCKDNQGIGAINIPGGPSVTQRAEESRELNFDFTYLADHATGGNCTDNVAKAWKSAITPKVELEGFDPDCLMIEPSPCAEQCPDNGSRCVCERVCRYVEGLGRDVVMIGNGNSQETAYRSYETSPPDYSCGQYNCTGNLETNYSGGVTPFMYNKLNTIRASNQTKEKFGASGRPIPDNRQTGNWKYITSIIAHPYENDCGTYKKTSQETIFQPNILIPFDDDLQYPLFSQEASNPSYPGVHGFPWQYPACYQSCDPWALWPEQAPVLPISGSKTNPDEGMRHRAAPMSGIDAEGLTYAEKIPHIYGYDGMEIVYQAFNREINPIKKTVDQRWRKEISDELMCVVADEIHPLDKNIISWDANEGPPDKFVRDIWHPFGTGGSNVLRWWMEPWNMFYGKNMTYIHAREFSAVVNDTKSDGLRHPIGYYLRVGKTAASGKGSFATMWLGTHMEDCPSTIIPPIDPPNDVQCSTGAETFQPGDMIAIFKDNTVYYKLASADIGYRILCKSAWSGGVPIKARVYLHKPNDNGTRPVLREYQQGDFKSWDLGDCGSAIGNYGDRWWYVDAKIPVGELESGPWALRLEVDFSCPGGQDETVLCSPIYSKK